jgi:aryl-alcohol dehydrogenase-like predicted oxidoreductase
LLTTRDLQYNNGIPADSRFAAHSDFFKDTLKSFNEEEGRAKIRKVQELTKLAETELGCNVTHLALAWVARNPNTSTVILGASKPEQVVDNLKALDVIPKLTPDILDKIEAILQNKPAPTVSNHHGIRL